MTVWWVPFLGLIAGFPFVFYATRDEGEDGRLPLLVGGGVGLLMLASVVILTFFLPWLTSPQP